MPYSWYDPIAEKRRSTLPWKVYTRLEPLALRLLYRVDSEHAHHISMRALWAYGKIEGIWFWFSLPFNLLRMGWLLTWHVSRWHLFRHQIMMGPKPENWENYRA